MAPQALKGMVLFWELLFVIVPLAFSESACSVATADSLAMFQFRQNFSSDRRMAGSLLQHPDQGDCVCGIEALFETNLDPACTSDRDDCGTTNIDLNSVELGVRFSTSEEIMVSGVRFYRANNNMMKVSIWNASCFLLATGAVESSAGLGWVDVTLNAMLPMKPGDEWIASYFAEAGGYAYNVSGFDSSLTMGSVTAAAPNGFFSYSSASTCPQTSSSALFDYYVSPLWEPTSTLEIDCPNNVEALGCDSSTSPASTGYPSITEHASCTVTLTSHDSYSYDHGVKIISRLWTATDSCERSETCHQQIRVLSHKPPKIKCPADKYATSRHRVDPKYTGGATAWDAYNHVSIKFTDHRLHRTGQNKILRKWIATNSCGNKAKCFQTILMRRHYK